MCRPIFFLSCVPHAGERKRTLHNPQNFQCLEQWEFSQFVELTLVLTRDVCTHSIHMLSSPRCDMYVYIIMYTT